MAMRTLGIRFLAAAMLAWSLAGCGSPPAGRLGPRIVGNNSASFQADARKAMQFGELDAEALIKTVPAPRPTPEPPDAPGPIRPRPQGEEGLDQATGHTPEYLALLDRVVAERPELADQVALLKATPRARLDGVHRAFRFELEKLGAVEALRKTEAWRKAGADVRLSLFRGKLRDIMAHQPPLPSIGN